MEKHPIENIMSSTLENLQSMIDVNTVVGSPIFSDSGAVIIPVSQVGFGFVAGGGEYGEVEKPQAPTTRTGRAFPLPEAQARVYLSSRPDSLYYWII